MNTYMLMVEFGFVAVSAICAGVAARTPLVAASVAAVLVAIIFALSA